MTTQNGAGAGGGSKDPEGRALPQEIVKKLGLVNFGDEKEIQSLRDRGCEYVAKETERLKELNDLFDGMFGLEARMEKFKAILGKNFIGPEHYREKFPDMDLGEIPPIPEKVTIELLNAECKLWPGKKVGETHILAYVPAVSIVDFIERANNEQENTFYIGSLGWLRSQSFATDKTDTGQWILIPKNILPGTTGQKNEQQIAEMRRYTDYKTANANPLAIAIAMNYLVNNDRIYSNFINSGRCAEAPYVGLHVVVGFFDARSLHFTFVLDESVGGRLGRAASWDL